MKKTIFVILIIIFSFFGIKAGLSLSRSAKPLNVPPKLVASNTLKESKPTIEEKLVPAPPQTIQIPKINVETSVESGGIDEQKKPILPKDPDNVIWYSLGSKPGEVGSAVMSGHFDKVTGAPAVFWDLKKLVNGDVIKITDVKGNEFDFKVVKTVDYPFDKVPLQEVYAAETSKPLLNLITCAGTWNASTKLYSSRTVVYAELAQ